MKAIQLLGLILWRGGVLLAVGYLAYLALRAVLTFTDTQLELAVAVLLTGVVFIFLSVLGERIADARAERRERQ